MIIREIADQEELCIIRNEARCLGDGMRSLGGAAYPLGIEISINSLTCGSADRTALIFSSCSHDDDLRGNVSPDLHLCLVEISWIVSNKPSTGSAPYFGRRWLPFITQNELFRHRWYLKLMSISKTENEWPPLIWKPHLWELQELPEAALMYQETCDEKSMV